MNDIHSSLKIGTIGEVLVQLRLLQFNVQAAPPIKDSGNDLIAVKDEIFRAIQVKTSTKDKFSFNKKELDSRKYHILALVKLEGGDRKLNLDVSSIFLLKKEEVNDKICNVENLKGTELEKRIDELFS